MLSDIKSITKRKMDSQGSKKARLLKGMGNRIFWETLRDSVIKEWLSWMGKLKHWMQF